MKSGSLTSTLTLLAAALLLAACTSAPKVRVDKDSSVNFAAYKTYAWLASDGPAAAAETPPGATPAPPRMNSLTDNRVRNAVAAALQAKGYVFDETHPDFRVGYTLNVYERPKESGVRIGLGAGGGGGNMAGGVGLSVPVGSTTEKMGTLIIDIIDSAKNAQVWTASYEQKVPAEGMSDKDANTVVSTILARFPNDPKK
jgi:Domain of unknown function (DUF4136)